MEPRLALMLAILVAGCDGRPVALDGGAAGRADLTGPCSCPSSGPTSLTGVMSNASIALADAAYGVETTWGSHAQPQDPCEALWLRVVLRPKAPAGDCGRDLQSLEIVGGAPVAPGRYPFTDLVSVGNVHAQVYGSLCLTQVPFAAGAKVACDSEEPGPLVGCADLVFSSLDDQVIGGASGPVRAPYCSSLNVSGGE